MAYRQPGPDEELIFRPYRIDPKTGGKIYPKTGKVFPMIVKKK